MWLDLLTNPSCSPVVPLITTMWTSRFADIKPFVASLECMAALRPDAVLSVSRRGIYSTSIDAHHVILMNLFVSADDMSHHQLQPASDGQDQEFVADLKSLTGILKLAVKRGETLISKKESDDALCVEFLDSKFQVQPKRGFVSGSDIEVPELDPQLCLTMTTKEAKRVFKEMSAIGGDIVLAYDHAKKRVSIACDGASGTAKILLADGSEGIVGLDGNASVQPQRYDAKLLNKIVSQKTSTGGKEVTIRIVDGFPVEVRHRVGDNGYIRFFLAPKLSL